MISITCSVCGTPVRMVEKAEDISTGDIILRAYCHGEVDEMRVTVRDMLELGSDGLDQLNHGTGVAFATKRITA